MGPALALASLLALLSADDAARFGCVCRRLRDADELGDFSDVSDGEFAVWNSCESHFDDENLWEVCENQDQLPFVLERLRTPNWRDRAVCPADMGALEAIRGLTHDQAHELSWNVLCRVAADCVDSCSLQGLNDTEWNAEMLEVDAVRNATLSQLLRAAQRITKAIRARNVCAMYQYLRDYNDTWARGLEAYLDDVSSYWRDQARLMTLGVPLVARLVAPLGIEYTRNHTSDQRPHGWFKKMKRLEDMFNTVLMGWLHDVQSVSDQIANYKIEEDKKFPGEYLIRCLQ